MRTIAFMLVALLILSWAPPCVLATTLLDVDANEVSGTPSFVGIKQTEHEQEASSTEKPPKGEKLTGWRKFLDKYVINGPILGSAVGSTAAIFALTALCATPPGFVATMTASVIGGLVGHFAGAYVDDRVGDSYNYSAFDRPPVTKGGVWLEGVGPREQAMYQVDAWGITGATVAQTTQAVLTQAALHLGTSWIPVLGPLARSIGGQMLFGAAGYALGTASDAIDGNVDLGDIGRRWDEEAAARAQNP